MRCSRCGHDNPYENFFCGNCGSPLLHRGSTSSSQPVMARTTDGATSVDQDKPIAGPSFLGLAEAEDTSSLEYLYDEEPQHHYGRMVLAILVLAAFGAFIVYQWKQSPKWRTALSRPLKQDAGQAQTQDRAAFHLPEKAAAPANAPLAPQDSSVQGSSQEPAPAADDEAKMHATAGVRPLPQSDAAAPVRSKEHAQQPPPPPARDDTEVLLARGVAHLYGRGAPRSCSDALVFLNRAADQGNTRAASQLGGLYATGHCVPPDRVKAYQYFTRASKDGGNVYLNRTRQMLWNQMSEAEKTLVRGTR